MGKPRKIDPADVLKRLEGYAKLARKDTDEAGWIAMSYSCTRNRALHMIEDARRWARDKAAAENAAKPPLTTKGGA